MESSIMTPWQASASSTVSRSPGTKGQGVTSSRSSSRCVLYPTTGIRVILLQLTAATKISLQRYLRRTQRDIIYICCLWKGNNICAGNWREKRVNELWGNWQRSSAWGSLDSREPRSYWQAFSPQTRGPPSSGHKQASLVKQWGRKYITDCTKHISAENNEAERIERESHGACDLLANSQGKRSVV